MADLELVPDREHEDLAGWVLGALDPEEHARFRAHLKKRVIKQTEVVAARSRTRDSTQAAAKLTKVVNGSREIVASAAFQNEPATP